MKLKHYLLTQNFKILISTILITVCLGLSFGQFYVRRRIGSGAGGYQSALLVGEDILFSGPRLTDYQVQMVLMDISAGKTETEVEQRQYTVTREQYVGQDGVLYTLLKLTPVFEGGSVYRSALLFVVFVFFTTFFIAVLLMRKKQEEDVIRPLIQLQKAVEKLTAGDLSAAIGDDGIGEVGEMCRSVEKLRLQLKDSVLQNEKYDDNRTFLLSSISHDLKTPVTAIRGYIEGALDGVADTPEKQRLYLTKAIEKIKMLTIMIEDLLLYSRLDTGQLPFSFSQVSALGYMQKQVEEFQGFFRASGRQLRLVNDLQSAAVLRIDPERFQRVVQNILDNARKHIEPETGMATVFLRETTASVIIEFRDNGPGVAPEALPHIFDRFYRADSARTTGSGSGLGLAIARQLVVGMGGRIWAVSPPGEGCSILVSLKKVKLMEEI